MKGQFRESNNDSRPSFATTSASPRQAICENVAFVTARVVDVRGVTEKSRPIVLPTR